MSIHPIDSHELAVLQFSGGKDSLACLHLMRPWWDKIIVMWVNTGDAFPETIEQMRQVKALVPRFQEISSNQRLHIYDEGWPSDIITVSATLFGRLVEGHRGPIVQGWPRCCGANIWAPMMRAVRASGATLIIQGTRESDPRRSPDSNAPGLQYHYPVWDWSTGKVLEYLRLEGLLPEHYDETATGLDCQHCTAFLNENADKMRYLARHHPAVSVEVQRRIKTIRDLALADLAHIEKAVM